jgi:hypothetical protein
MRRLNRRPAFGNVRGRPPRGGRYIFLSAIDRRMEVVAGLEPAKTGFADQRLDHFGITRLGGDFHGSVFTILFTDHA